WGSRPGARQGPPGGRARPAPVAPEPDRSPLPPPPGGVGNPGGLHRPPPADDEHTPAAPTGACSLPLLGPHPLAPPAGWTPRQGDKQTSRRGERDRAFSSSVAAPLAAVGPAAALGQPGQLVRARPGDCGPRVAGPNPGPG